jgi:hypothetical protein
VIIGPAKFDFGALTHIAAFNEALPKRGYKRRIGLLRSATEVSNHWHLQLLRTRVNRPCSCRTAQQKSDEFAPPCMSGKQHIEG